MKAQLKKEQAVWRKPAAAQPAEDRELTAVELLAQQAGRGDRQALHELCRLVGKKVLFGAKRMLPHHQDSEDVAQKALRRMCENIRQLRDPRAFTAWLNTIVLNEARTHMRESARQASVVYLDEIVDEVPEDNEDFLPLEYALRQEEHRVVIEIVDALPARQREAILLHYYEDLSVADVAQVMGVTHQGVSAYLKRAREKIRAELERRAQREEGGAKLGALALLPIGPLVAEVLGREAASLGAAGSIWAGKAAQACLQGLGGKAAASAAAGAAGGALALKPAALAAGVVLALGIVSGAILGINRIIQAGNQAAAQRQTAVQAVQAAPGTGEADAAQPEPESLAAVAMPRPASQPEAAPPLPGAGNAMVTFIGGDSVYAHLNPKAAQAETDGEGLADISWVIRPHAGGEALYSGSGGYVEEPFASLPDGEYWIAFTIVSKNGDVLIHSSVFQILT